VTDANGEFRLAGSAYELVPFENIHPWLKIFHRCARHILQVGFCHKIIFFKLNICPNRLVFQICDSEAKFKLPNDNKYFKDENSVVEFGTFNLEVKLHDDATTCIHSA
jgi:hypothetical protein